MATVVHPVPIPLSDMTQRLILNWEVGTSIPGDQLPDPQSNPCSTATEDCKQDKVSRGRTPIGGSSTLRSRPTPMRYLLCTPRLVAIYAL